MTEHQNYKPRIADIALQAGVGTATVDRVLNNRPGVKEKTVQKVMAAARFLEQSGGRPRVIAPTAAGLNLRAFLGGAPGFANEILGRALRESARMHGVPLALDFVKRTDPMALAAQLRGCLEDGTSGVIVQAVEHPFVRDAIAELITRGLHVTSVLTQMPGLDGLGYIGLDNRAAGRLAGQILGLLCGGKGEIAVFHSDAIYRSHEEREAGLRSVLREDFPDIRIVETISTDDNPNECFRRAQQVLSKHPDLTGLVNLAAGNRGIERALLDSGRATELTFVAFNLTPLSRKALVERTMDAVIHQDMTRIAEEAVTAQIAAHQGKVLPGKMIPTELILRENLKDASNF
ncbi:LacI family DNA-binding transcriptional regulator [Sinirhodobacter sp. WL0062]|uniref:LacI family DNA-binding transcriptional regulator n=1 Tax=Rhodobacter flavimaris TaxID=2907145 RepID=A0ABS8YVF8_9RHOB|nr:LacI family DNA-binding transcriptional regulator [Sinirhodobacter sp. WL0062]MCE5973080.1 LacI family DNA-binding transcriptional regulator [Sinirhodobacter sp. WL0062]